MTQLSRRDEKLTNLLQEAAGVMQDAIEACEPERVSQVTRLLNSLTQVQELIKAFQSANGRITGKDGVAALLNLKPNTVYARLDQLQIDADAFRDPSLDLVGLVMKSPLLCSIVDSFRMSEKVVT